MLGWLIRPTRRTFAFALVGLFVEIGWIWVWFGVALVFG